MICQLSLKARRVSIWPILLLSVTFIASACSSPEIPIDGNSGADMERIGARKVFPGQKVTDIVNSSVGDNTDWKEIPIQERGTMAVTVALDSTRGMKGFVAVKDTFGIELGRQPISTRNTKYTFDRIPVYPGNYFVQIFADRGKSVYTTGVNFEPLVKPAPRQVNTSKSEAPPASRRRYIKPATGAPPSNSNAAEGKKDVEANKTEATVADKSNTAESASTVAVRGRIIRITPRDKGGSIIQLEGLGTNNGVASGMSGTIAGTKTSVVIQQVRSNSSTATTKASADSIKSSGVVIVRVPKSE